MPLPDDARLASYGKIGRTGAKRKSGYLNLESSHSQLERTANNLRVDAATAEVLRAYAGAGIQTRLLKGSALGHWYQDGDRPRYLDADLWVRPHDFSRAEELLDGLQFTRILDQRVMPAWWQSHASEWLRESDGVVIDLHRTLQGVSVDPDAAWEVLASEPRSVEVAGWPATALSDAAAALYVTLHAAHHGSAARKSLDRLERALAEVPRHEWRAATALAEQVAASEAFAVGLRLVPQGVALAEELGLPFGSSIQLALKSMTPPPVALGLQQLRDAGGVGAALRILVRKLVPPPAFVRHWWPPAARNRRMLLLGYLYRPVWLLRSTPQGLRAWRRARRKVKGGS